MGDYRDSYVGKQQRPPCLPIGLLVAALEAKKAARKDSLAAQAQSRGDVERRHGQRDFESLQNL